MLYASIAIETVFAYALIQLKNNNDTDKITCHSWRWNNVCSGKWLSANKLRLLPYVFVISLNPNNIQLTAYNHDASVLFFHYPFYSSSDHTTCFAISTA